jgi:hypothetical protein
MADPAPPYTTKDAEPVIPAPVPRHHVRTTVENADGPAAAYAAVTGDDDAEGGAVVGYGQAMAGWGASVFARAKDSTRSWDATIRAVIDREDTLDDARAVLLRRGLPYEYYSTKTLPITADDVTAAAARCKTNKEVVAFFTAAILAPGANHSLVTLHAMEFTWGALIAIGMDYTHMAHKVGVPASVFCDVHALTTLYGLSLVSFVTSFPSPACNTDTYDYVLAVLMGSGRGCAGLSARSLQRLHGNGRDTTPMRALVLLGMSARTMAAAGYSREQWTTVLGMTAADVGVAGGVDIPSETEGLPGWMVRMDPKHRARERKKKEKEKKETAAAATHTPPVPPRAPITGFVVSQHAATADGDEGAADPWAGHAFTRLDA